MTNEELDKLFEEVDKEQENKGRAMLCLYAIIAFAVAFILGVWWLVYTFTSSSLSKDLDSIKPIYIAEENEVSVEAVYYVIDNKEYTDSELLQLASVPTVLDVHVYYSNNVDIVKSAYVCYDDIDSISYIDGTFGKVILPQNK